MTEEQMDRLRELGGGNLSCIVMTIPRRCYTECERPIEPEDDHAG